MFPRLPRYFRPALLFFGFGALFFTSWAQTRPKSGAIPEIAAYTYWREITQKPVPMQPRVASACASGNFFAPTPKPPTIVGTQGPHAQKFIRVFVNGAGEDAMTTQKEPLFPVGTVIVKQKLPLLQTKPRKNSKSKVESVSLEAELLTIMIKREKDYDAPNGDWEYLVSDGAGKVVAQRGKLASCQGCHRPFAKTDYIVRSYLPAEVEKALRNADVAVTASQSEPPASKQSEK